MHARAHARAQSGARTQARASWRTTRANGGRGGHSQTALFLRSMPEAPGRTAALPMLASAIFASALPTVLAATTEKTQVTISLLPNMQKVQACGRACGRAGGRAGGDRSERGRARE